MRSSKLLLSIVHFVWCLYGHFKVKFILPIKHRWCCMGPAKFAPKDNQLVLCHYQFTDGRLFTYVQPSAPSDVTLCCAVISYENCHEVDISDDIVPLAGPHFDFHGSELTVYELLSCIENYDNTKTRPTLTITLDHAGELIDYTFFEHDTITINY